jgi:hypothetical protein
MVRPDFAVWLASSSVPSAGNEWQYPSNNQTYAIRQQYNKVASLATPHATDTSEVCRRCLAPYRYNFDPKNPRFTRPAGLVAMDANYKRPSSYQVNFGVQQQFGRSTAPSLSYVGSLTRELPLFFEHNYPSITSVIQQQTLLPILMIEGRFNPEALRAIRL